MDHILFFKKTDFLIFLASQFQEESKMEHVPCTDIPCLNGCAFNGGYSGYCSVCWRGLSDDAKREANAKQVFFSSTSFRRCGTRRRALHPFTLLLSSLFHLLSRLRCKKSEKRRPTFAEKRRRARSENGRRNGRQSRTSCTMRL